MMGVNGDSGRILCEQPKEVTPLNYHRASGAGGLRHTGATHEDYHLWIVSFARAGRPNGEWGSSSLTFSMNGEKSILAPLRCPTKACGDDV